MTQHRLLRRQVRRFFGSPDAVPAEVRPFLDAVEQAYQQFDADRILTERAMRISSEELRRAIEDAQKASQIKSEFLANMSHEIRTPMNAIIGLSEILREAPIDEENREHVRIIHSSAEALLALLNDILDVSKIEAGKLELAPEPIDLEEHLDGVMDLFVLRAEKKGLELRLDRQTPLPARIVVDPVRLRQVLVNLLSNALKFTPEGEVVFEIGFRPTDDDTGVLSCAVRDTGIGIPADRIGRLFKSFSQVDASTTRSFGGTGLGLAISRQLVRMMGGEIRVKSSPGLGSTFLFDLNVPVDENTLADEDPDAPGASTAPPSNRQIMEKPPPLAESCPLNILVVEDNNVNAKVIGKILERLGYPSDRRENGATGLEAIRTNAYDIVIMDVQMPVLDGLEATRSLRKTVPKDSPPYLLALTAGACKEDAESCLEAGMHAFLSKPVRIHELEQALRSAYAWLCKRTDRDADREQNTG